jgi:endogenous inhibitor of DNA gyrase (YacG/DUF329 family)
MNCPLCRKETIWQGNPWRPFCSERCQLTDLGAWASEQFRVPGPPLTMEFQLAETLGAETDIDAEQTE